MTSGRFDEVRDYAFADQALALRKRAGLTQRELATLLRVSGTAIRAWEGGLSYPDTAHLKALIALYLERGVLQAGREREEAEALWARVRARAARRTEPFDPAWFMPLRNAAPEDGPAPDQAAPLPDGVQARRHDWGDAPAAPVIQGRIGELATLRSWIVEGHCRAVQVLGAGGIGKTILATRLAYELAPSFAVVYWRSLRNTPPADEWLGGAIAALSGGQPAPYEGLDARLGLLLELLREQRALLVLDNLETVLEPGAPTVRYRPGYEAYAALLAALATSAHRGCLLLTSREQPLPADEPTVQTLRLGGLGEADCRALLGGRNLQGDEAAWRALVERYGGNPLALRVVGETIGAVFSGDVAAFLAEGVAVFGGIRHLLSEQVTRLSMPEQAILEWLAVAREPVGFAELTADLGPGIARAVVVEAVEALRRRSLLDWAPGGTFTLQPVVLEYTTGRLLATLTQEIIDGEPVLLAGRVLLRAGAREDVRRSQERLFAQPLLERLRSSLGSAAAVERRLLALLEAWRGRDREEQGYGPGNIVNLLRLLRGHLRGLNLSRLAIRHAFLEGVEAQDMSLAGAHLTEVVLDDPFDSPVGALSNYDGTATLRTAPSGAWPRTAHGDRRYERTDITGLTGVTDVQRSVLQALGAIEHPPRWAGSPAPDKAVQLEGGRSPAGRPPINLPSARTSFVGRGAELANLAQALDASSDGGVRLLTLTGVAGSGKTRLAFEAAHRVRDAYGDGVWLIDLAPLLPSSLADAGALVAAILAVLALHEQPGQAALDTLIAHLRSRRLLLLLDNCEHLLPACAALATHLLTACPGLRILATSQRALDAEGERVWPVAPLVLPAPVDANPSQEALAILEQSESVQLFVERARAVQAGFILGVAVAPFVAAICRRLDGLPLAIELAAARLHVLAPAEVLARLDDRFRLLRRGGRAADARHQTLQATLDWSYALLQPVEQAVLRRLAVFAGGWDVAAAEAVCAGEDVGEEDVLDVIDELVNRSLVYVLRTEGTSRYGMLETVRQYGLLLLEREGEVAAVQGRRLRWCLALAEQSVASLQSAEQDAWLERLEREHDNLRAALHWSLGGGAAGPAALRLAGALARFWVMHAHFSEGRRWLGEALAAEGGTAAERARALDGAGLLAEGQGAYAEAKRLLEESLALWREVGDQAGAARALANRGLVAGWQGDFARAREWLAEALAIFRALDARDDLADTLSTLGIFVEFQGDAALAWSLLEEGLGLFRAEGDGRGTANTLGYMAVTARRHGEYARALALYEEALAGARTVGDQRGVARWLNGLALSMASQGAYARAQALLEESLAVSRAQGDLRSMAASFNDLGEVARKQGAFARAGGLFEESLALQRQFGDEWGIANSYRNLADVADQEGDADRAARLLAQSLARFRAVGDRWGVAYCLEIGGRMAARGMPADAATLLAGAVALREALGTQLEPDELEAHERLRQAISATLGEARFAAVWADGRALPLDDLLATFARAIGTADAGQTTLAASASPLPPHTNLPTARTSFVGRQGDLLGVGQALGPADRGGARLLTVVGVAGSGKTRLALAAAWAACHAYQDGAWLVELAPLPANPGADPTPVAEAALAALGLREQPDQTALESLIMHLRSRHILLLLDNCEHLVAACAVLTTRLLAACPDVRILATSQYALGAAHEMAWRLGTLTVPDTVDETPTAAALRVLEATEAVQLFVERARAVQPGFSLSAATAPSVAAICRRLDGLPLAIELAAARLNVLPVEEVRARLDARFHLLRRGGRGVADRHQALQAALDWSYGLLDAVEQTVLRRLAVFAGGWDLAAAEAVCAGEGVDEEDVLGALDELLARSLVDVHQAHGAPRYRLLETVLQYGLQQLERAGEGAVMRDRQLAWCAALAAEAAPALLGPEQATWQARLEREHENARAAMQWALERGRTMLGLRVAGGLGKFWLRSGRQREGRRWLAALLAATPDEEGDEAIAVQAAALEAAAGLAEDAHEFDRAAALFAQSNALRRALGQDEHLSAGLINAAMEARARGDYAHATAMLEESLAQHRAQSDHAAATPGNLGPMISFAYRYTLLASVLTEQGEYERAHTLGEECLAQSRTAGDTEGIAVALLSLSDIARDQGDAPRVRARCEESLALFRELGHRWAIGFSLNNLAQAAYLEGDLAQAADSAEESAAIFREMGAGPSLAEVLVTLGRVRGAQGAATVALGHLREALTLAGPSGPRWVEAAALSELGVQSVRQGSARHGVELLAAAAALRREMGIPVRPADRPALDAALATAHAILGDDDFHAAWAAGAPLLVDRIVVRAIEEA